MKPELTIDDSDRVIIHLCSYLFSLKHSTAILQRNEAYCEKGGEETLYHSGSQRVPPGTINSGTRQLTEITHIHLNIRR